MTRKLLIVESPAKKKTIQGYLGEGWTVTASFGHVRDLPVRELGVDRTTLAPTYEVTDKSKRTVSSLKELAKAADVVFLATDPDREGEAIAWHLKEVLRLKDPKRVTFNEITKAAVTAAVAKPRTIDVNLVRAQEARRVADRLVGYQVSPVLSDVAGAGVSLSAGRVQSVALRLVVDREREIENFKAIDHFGARLSFTTGAINWSADWKHSDDSNALCTDRARAEHAATAKRVTVKGIEREDVKRAAPAPFITSTMQMAAGNALGFNPKRTMAAAQQLFDAGLITYLRTDNPNFSDEGAAMLRGWLEQNGYREDLPATPNRWRAKASAQEAHEAIRPTHVEERAPAIEDADAKALYEIIWLRAVASQLKPLRAAVTKILLAADNGCDFIARGEVVEYEGWRKLLKADDSEEAADSDDVAQGLPAIEEGAIEDVRVAQVLSKRTKPPARYSLPSLTKKLENEGIGRPATYASIMDNIVNRAYIEERKKKVYATDLGKTVVDALVGRFEFMEISYTREMENSLDAIAAGNASYQTTVNVLQKKLLGELGHLAAAASSGPVHACSACGSPMKLRKSKNAHFWGCSKYPECKNTAPDVDGKPGVRTSAEPPSSVKVECPACSKPMRRRSGANGMFWGCTGYPGCKKTMDDKDGQPTERTPAAAASARRSR